MKNTITFAIITVAITAIFVGLSTVLLNNEIQTAFAQGPPSSFPGQGQSQGPPNGFPPNTNPQGPPSSFPGQGQSQGPPDNFPPRPRD